MAQFLFLCFLLGNVLLGLAMATDISAPSSDPPAEAPVIRKLGKHHQKQVTSSVFPSLTPSVAPESEKKVRSNSERGIPSHQRTSVEPENEEVSGFDGEHHHHSVDKSVAGGGVILGGLATTFMVAVFCYIRATRRHNAETQSTA